MVEKVEDTNADRTEVKEKVVETSDVTTSKKGPADVPYSRFSKYVKKARQAEGDLAEKQAELEIINAELIEANGQIELLSGYKIKMKEFDTERLTEKLNKWNEDSKILNAVEGDKIFEKIQKIKDRFSFGTEEAPLTNEQIDNNEKLFNIYLESGYLEVPKTTTENLNTTVVDKVGPIGDFFGYGDKVALMRGNPVKWLQWQRENPGK